MIVEPLCGLNTPLQNLSVALRIVESLVIGKLSSYTDQRSGHRRGRPHRCGPLRYLFERQFGLMRRSTWGDDTQRQMVAVLPDDNDRARLVTIETDQLDRAVMVANTDLGRRGDPSVTAIGHQHYRRQALLDGGVQVGEFVFDTTGGGLMMGRSPPSTANRFQQLVTSNSDRKRRPSALATAEDGLRAALVADALIESMNSGGRWVEVTD
ncbi:hypothetical protein H7J55_01940 [Mycolicibacterium brisbanense]|uniref:Uncharacterized protein n=1 Tax=Mycolicibacterium brisbanense TaxID=146020 RepID=A0A100VUN7_9MYCO|nr:hypothetical protein [Mycolicibacterium brisbanense]GAS86378.1 uncharacterized protein RMCB_0474 [Mycolicibacterium brisbanense]